MDQSSATGVKHIAYLVVDEVLARKELLLHIGEVNGQLCRATMTVLVNNRICRVMVKRRRRRRYAVSSISISY